MAPGGICVHHLPEQQNQTQGDKDPKGEESVKNGQSVLNLARKW